ncbi:MAG TPA: protein kinase [Chitinivibrionales bacterium]|jgi:serine/threonine protein kinase|nr:protein kinase [Chitinivibrionales bacterium]
MNTSINPDDPRQEKQPSFDKTFIEGPDAKTGSHGFDANARLDATQVGATNPYVKQTTTQIYSPDNLPSGNEPLPLGSGTIVGLLGAGGMARVYKIWNDKLEVFRAVKILIPTQQGDLRNRFETEAKITAKLRHPNIVEIYSVGDWKGLPFLEMELIDGVSLEAMIGSSGKLPPQVCSSIAIFVARALSYAHNQDFLLYGKTYHGIIHRDLKPANIMIAKHGDLRLMDFGIARPTEASLHTVDGNIVGTMQYLSPEQMDGVDIDGRADVYAFGAILYEMLTGTKTFPQDTITNLMKKKIMNEYRKFDEFDFSVPPVLAKISQKCLQLEKENRYANAEALLDELEEAHRSLTPDSPEAVLKAYIANPSSILNAVKSGRPAWLSLKIVLPAAGVLVVAALAAVFLVTGPKPAQQEQKPAAPSQPQQAVPPPAALPQNAPVQQLQPLSPQSTQQPAAPPPQATPAPSKPERHAASSARAPQRGRETAREQPHEKGTAQAVSPLESLKKKYHSDDPLAIGQSALAQSAYDDVAAALENVPVSSPQHPKALLLQADALIQSDKLRGAKEMLLNNRIDDAEYFMLCGEMYQRMGRNKDALDNLQTALTKPSNYRNVRDVRNDALYYTAVAYGELYKDDPSADNRGLALQSWRVVKNMYASGTGNPRYKRAVTELANIK